MKAADVARLHQMVRQEKPLVHHITNLVVTNVTANITLALGASPVMAHSPDEVGEMASMARALVLNIGTLSRELVESMILAGRAANDAGVPVVLDPVGAGATRLRTEAVEEILGKVRVDIIRGNRSEISIIGGFGGNIQGVDAVSGGDPREIALATAKSQGCVVAVTGAEDYISDGRRVAVCRNGHPLLTAVTGTGCMATSVVAAFAAVAGDPFLAAAAALGFYGLAAERAATSSSGPGSFAVALFDAVYGLTERELQKGLKLEMEGDPL